MSMRLKITFASSFAIAGLLAGMAMPAQSARPRQNTGISPALCGPADNREPGIQGDLPVGQTAAYNCGVRLIGQLPRVGNVQGVGKCAYVRGRGPGAPGGPPGQPGQIYVIDVSDPANPKEVGSVPVRSGSETMRVRVNSQRALLVSGSSVYDISDCLRPKLLGEIKWPPLRLAGIPSRLLPHDIRINHAGTRVWASFGLWEADITNLRDPNSWKVTDHRCTLAAQTPGPWQEVHRVSLKFNLSICDDSNVPGPRGADFLLGASPLSSSLIWPTLSHSPDTNANDTLVYIGDQAGGNSGTFGGPAMVSIVDVTKSPPQIVGRVNGPGHGLDWFRSGGRDYLLHSNEAGTGGVQGQAAGGDPCRPYPRPAGLGWGFEVLVSDVTQPRRARNVSMLRIAINDPEFCAVRKASGRDPWVAYHMIDREVDPRFAMVNFGTAGLRIFDIRQPTRPREVAYFNDGNPVHGGIGYYDAARGLIYAASSKGFSVLEIEPQVRAHLGL